MVDRSEPVHVTRVEFYSALAFVWLYIQLLVFRLANTLSTYLLGAAAFLMFMGCIVKGFRARRLRETAANQSA